MQDITEIKIIGLDQTRLPRTDKKTYIDLFFQLSEEAPQIWCELFNDSTSRLQPSIKIDKKRGLFIDTYVRNMDDIPAHLELLKQKVAEANSLYAETIRQRTLAAASANASVLNDGGPQGRLNAIIAGLNFAD